MAPPDRLRALLDVVQDSLDRPGTRAGDLAGRAYLSRFHFSRVLAAAVGEPPGAFRRRLLLERAAVRLRRTDDPVTEVAWEADFGSPEAFTRAFARAYGAAPSTWRTGTGGHELPAPSGIHIHPPGGLRLPATGRSTGMDVLTRMIDHHLELTGAVLDRARTLDDAVLDAPIRLSVEGIDADMTLRRLAGALVGQLERWVAVLDAAPPVPARAAGDPPVGELCDRLAVAAPAFRDAVVGALEQGRAGETVVDTGCEPPRTFTLGGIAAHVLTFAAVRRTIAIGALADAGVTDLGSGDPMVAVGGAGEDAALLSR